MQIYLIEEMILNPMALPEELMGYRRYRISYGGVNEACLYEGNVLLPADADQSKFEKSLQKFINKYEHPTKCASES